MKDSHKVVNCEDCNCSSCGSGTEGDSPETPDCYCGRDFSIELEQPDTPHAGDRA